MDKNIETLLKINAIAATSMLLSSVLISVTSVILLFISAPFVPDAQEEQIKEFLAQTPFPMALSFGWVVGSAFIGVKLNQLEADPNDDLVEVARQKQKSLEQCQSCRYLVQDKNAAAFLKYPCAVHPKGPADVCGDWADFWLKYYEEEKVFESR